MYPELTHRIIEELLEHIEREEPEWRISRRLRDSREYDRLIKHVEHTIGDYLARATQREFEAHWRRELLHIERRQDARLDRIEEAIAAARVPCRFSEGSPEYTELVTIKRELIQGRETTSADPLGFMEALKKIARTADTLVLVDPYALSKEDDTGEGVSSVDAIKDILAACPNPRAHLHLYCRTEPTNEDEWRNLRNAVGAARLSVHLVDLHDRFILAGSETRYDGYQDTHPHPGWLGSKYWGGAAFGSSINGSGKRPTYVLNFKQKDIDSLRAYLEDVAKEPTSLEDFITRRAAAAAAKAAKLAK